MSRAWLLDLGGGCRAAVGERELVHLLYAPQSYPVPGTPAHARAVLAWQERLLPVFDVVNWLGGATPPASLPVAGILAYQNGPGETPEYGALRLAAPPARVSVTDQQACGLPGPHWQALAIACFEHEGAAVPILDLRRLYGAVLAQAT